MMHSVLKMMDQAEVDALTKKRELKDWEEKLALNREVQRKANVVERVSLEEEEAVKARFDTIERDALHDMTVMI